MDAQDRELLEMAAKAAALDFMWINWNGVPGDETYPHAVYSGEARPWNPLKDDGDAFRLAMKLGVEIYPDLENKEVSTAYMVGSNGHNKVEEFGDHLWDASRAARYAIVLSAAHFGRAMP